MMSVGENNEPMMNDQHQPLISMLLTNKVGESVLKLTEKKTLLEVTLLEAPTNQQSWGECIETN